ncbi:MAG TPA: hypothetical protein VHY22_05370 [Chthoniobacteraceae bacterium]|jgi:hypothetical protein|nr:hypothetical protein [Chthoniobacteraceae bacterium]
MVKAGKARPGAWAYVARNPGGFTAYCSWCKCERDFVKSRVHNSRHLIATILTGGLWLAGWLAVCIDTALRPWRCHVCGWHKPEFRVPLNESLKIGPSALKQKEAAMGDAGDKIVPGPLQPEWDDTNFRAAS